MVRSGKFDEGIGTENGTSFIKFPDFIARLTTSLLQADRTNCSISAVLGKIPSLLAIKLQIIERVSRDSKSISSNTEWTALPISVPSVFDSKKI